MPGPSGRSRIPVRDGVERPALRLSALRALPAEFREPLATADEFASMYARSNYHDFYYRAVHEESAEHSLAAVLPFAKPIVTPRR